VNILVIEDNQPSAFLLASLCQGNGREVSVANTMAQAREKLTGARFELIFLDLGLTDSTPKESIAAISELKTLAQVVVITTGYENPSLRESAKDADAFLLKDDPNFADRVMSYLDGL